MIYRGLRQRMQDERNKPMEWKEIYLFISSTFNDMHAERDYLIKRVFPELRLWCSKRRLKLIDVDLRWGVSEADAQENKRVVDVCMKNIDKCRPFFLCFLGQRRGWIPGMADVSEETFKQFPGLSDYLGKHSITELEVIHALEKPLDGGSNHVRHAFFYFRDPDYLNQLDDHAVREVFAPKNQTERSKQEFDDFKAYINEKYGASAYSARWNRENDSPELKNVGGIDLSKGRLEHFQVGETPLGSHIIGQLKQAISEEFPDHMNMEAPKTALEEELLSQSAFLFHACDAYITRDAEEQGIRDYLGDETCMPYVICGEAGSGKTSLLAHLIREWNGKGSLFYRFIGTSAESADMERTFELLADEFMVRGLINERQYASAEESFTRHFAELLEYAAKKTPVILFLDGLDQWERLNQELTWVCGSLPQNVKLVLSLREQGAASLEEKLELFDIPVHRLSGMSSEKDRKAMIRHYLGQFLKDVDEKQTERILALEGSCNPLYLKIVLNELRMFGSFDMLWEQLNKNYGKTPAEAFTQVLARLETEPFSQRIESVDLVKTVLAMMACSLEGIRIKDLIPVFQENEKYSDIPDEEISDAAYALIHHLDMYLTVDGEYVDFLYDSFRRAARRRYAMFFKKRIWNGYLTDIYKKRCLTSEDRESSPGFRKDLVLLGYHALRSPRDAACEVFTDAKYIYFLLREAGPSVVADYLQKVDDQGIESPHMKELAEFILKESAALSVNANILFYLLDHGINAENTVAGKLIRQASETMDLSYFRPVRPPKRQEFVPYREIVYPDDGIRRDAFVVGEYLVYVMRQPSHREGQRDDICVQNLRDEQTIVTHSIPGAVMWCEADDRYLYLKYISWENDVRKEGYEVLEIPSLHSVMLRKHLPESMKEYIGIYEIRTRFLGYQGVLYGMAVNPNRGFRVYRLEDGKMIMERCFAEDEMYFDEEKQSGERSYETRGTAPFILEKCYEDGSNHVWYMFTGEKVWSVPDCTVSLAVKNDDLYIFWSTKEEREVLKYHFNKTEVLLREKKEIPKSVGCGAAVVGEDCILAFGLFYDVSVLDRELHYLGNYLNGVGGHPQLRDVYVKDGEIIYVRDIEIRRFKKSHLMECLKKERDYSSVTVNSNSMMFDYKDNLYVTGSKISRIDMRTGEVFDCPGKQSLLYYNDCGYCPEPIIVRVGDVDMVTGYTTMQNEDDSKIYLPEMQRLDTFETQLRFPVTIPEGYFFEGVGYQNLSVGIVSSDHANHLYLPDPSPTNPGGTDAFYRVLLQSYRIAINAVEPAESDGVSITARNFRLFSIPELGSFLLCTDVYLDETRRGIYVYDMKGTPLIREEYKNDEYVRLSKMVINGSSVYFTKTVPDPEHPGDSYYWKNILTEINLEEGKIFSYPIGYDSKALPKIVGNCRDEIILETNEYDESIWIFDTQKKQVVKKIRLDIKGKLWSVVHKYHMYICESLNSDIFHAYAEDGTLLFSQLFSGCWDRYFGDEGDMCIVSREGFVKNEPVFYCVGNTSELNK